MKKRFTVVEVSTPRYQIWDNEAEKYFQQFHEDRPLDFVTKARANEICELMNKHAENN